MKSLYNIILVMGMAFLATACFDKKQPNYQYFPDMYTSPSYEAYQEAEIFPDQQEAMKPVKNSVPRGWVPPKYPDTPEGRELASANLTNPLPNTERNLENGKMLYDIYCAICHGKKGDGKGPLAEREKIMGIPGFADPNRDVTEGDVYHTIYYGLNNMGSYASQTTRKERWQIVHYVMTLKAQLQGKPVPEVVEDTTTNSEHFDPEIDPVVGRQVMISTESK